MDATELIGLHGKEVKVQSGRGKAITKADLLALSGPEVKKMLEVRKLVLDAVIPAPHADKVKILAVWEKYDGMSAAWSACPGGLTADRLAAANKLRTATDMFFAAFLDIATANDITPYMYEVAWHFPRWIDLHGNLDALRTLCMEHRSKKINEGSLKCSNHQPRCLLKSSKVTLSGTSQVMKRSTLMAHYRTRGEEQHRSGRHVEP
eukprot:jgi/Tetstr1/461508/TSEL_006614.t1